MSRAPIAVLCAIEDELAHLRANLPPPYEDWHADRRAWLTTLDGQPVVLARCGIGMASAAAATEAIIQRYRPAALLNYGCAGAHRPDLLPGDLVIGARVVAQDRVMLEADGAERYLGMWYQRADEPTKVPFLPGAPALLALAAQAAEELEGRHEPWPSAAGWPVSVPHRSPRLTIGTVATSDRWTRAQDRIARIVAAHDSACEEMEAAAIALTCAGHGVSFLAVKDISNNELLRTTGDEWSAETEGQLGRRAAALVLTMLRRIADAPNLSEVVAEPDEQR
jgi:adenosylhomocysteine nucleosidase